MLKYIFAAVVCGMLFACNSGTKAPEGSAGQPEATAKKLDSLFAQYWEERMQLYPLEATANGDNRYNDRYTITISESSRGESKQFFTKYLNAVTAVDTAGLDDNHKISYQLFKYEMESSIEGYKYPTHLMPINQFWSPTLDLPVLGSGQGNQPFKTVKDYDNWLKRLSVFPAWTDTAIANMRKGIAMNYVLPEKLVIKILPQLKAMDVATEASIFYKPIKTMPDSLSAEKARLTAEYTKAIVTTTACYKKLYEFFKTEYLPKSRKTTGIKDVPGGDEYYRYCIRSWTTTQLTPDSIYNLGLAEVSRIETEMNKVKEETGFKGDMKAFFYFINHDKQFFTFTTAQQVLDSFWNIKKQEDPLLEKLFNHKPKSPFTIRQTEDFRAASASAEYNPGSADGTRPGIFYVPIIDPKKFNAVGMNTLFLHEAIPGHHYQISIAQENTSLPEFRKFLWYGAYGEGWALYSETLGKQMGMYNNPYQYFGHLSDGMHRAIRLVVDIGMHYKGMTREEAIAYMEAHEPTTEEGAIAEIERYMAIPGQALSYKIGQLTISGERAKYEKELGSKFNIASFHDEVLKDGCLPLEVLQAKLAAWARRQ